MVSDPIAPGPCPHPNSHRPYGAGNFGDHRSVGAGVSELRIAFGPGYRLYYGREGNTLVVLLGGGTKGPPSPRQEYAVHFKGRHLWGRTRACS